MKRKIMILLAVCLLLTAITVQAADENLGLVVDGSLMTELTEVSGSTEVSNLARGTYLGTGSAKLSNNGNHVLNVWGNTTCNKTCDEVKVTLHLQRYKNGSWSNVTTLDTKVAYNDHYVSNSKNVTVTGGYYYRISGSHTAIKGSVVETTTSVTDGMWVSR